MIIRSNSGRSNFAWPMIVRKLDRNIHNHLPVIGLTANGRLDGKRLEHRASGQGIYDRANLIRRFVP